MAIPSNINYDGRGYISNGTYGAYEMEVRTDNFTPTGNFFRATEGQIILRQNLIRNFQKFGWQLRIGLWDQFPDPDSASDKQNQRGATWCAR